MGVGVGARMDSGEIVPDRIEEDIWKVLPPWRKILMGLLTLDRMTGHAKIM